MDTVYPGPNLFASKTDVSLSQIFFNSWSKPLEFYWCIQAVLLCEKYSFQHYSLRNMEMGDKEHTKLTDVLLKVILDYRYHYKIQYRYQNWGWRGLIFYCKDRQNTGIKNGGQTVHTHTPHPKLLTCFKS